MKAVELVGRREGDPRAGSGPSGVTCSSILVQLKLFKLFTSLAKMFTRATLKYVYIYL